jgi:hypothetical protein
MRARDSRKTSTHTTHTPPPCSAGGEENRKYFLVTLFDFLPNIAPDSQRCSEFFIVLSELTKQYRSTYVALSFPDLRAGPVQL